MTALLATLLLALSTQLSTSEEATKAPDANGAVTAEAPANPLAATPPESAAPVGVQTPAAASAASEITLPGASGTTPTFAEPAVSAGSPATPPSIGATSAAPGATSQTESDAAAMAAFSGSPASVPTGDTTTPTQQAPETSVLSGGPKPAEFMRRLLTPPPAGQLSGVAISLGDAMAGATERSAQTQRAEAYWDLSAAVCQYYLALSEVAELASLRQAVLQPAAAWDVAAADVAKRVEQTRQSATAKQLRLHRLMGAAGGSLPLPADAPHCGRYNTRYEEIFVTRMDPAARQLNEMLPLLHSELVADVRLFEEAKEWTNYVSEVRDPKTDGVGLLRAYELMALRRRDFVETAHQYNLQIAAYTELAAPEQVESARLVSMLIRVSNAIDAAPGVTSDQGEGVTPATATEPVDGAAGDDSAAVRSDAAPRVFAWRPFERLRNRERSIVTSRRLLRLPFRGNEQY